MVILVTGGAGFIGSWFCDLVLERYANESILCLDKFTYCTSRRTTDLLSEKYGSRFSVICGDICLDSTWLRVPTVTELVHFAGESSVSKSFEHPEMFEHSNVLGTVKALQFSRDKHIPFLHISTDEVYGECFPNEPVATENSPMRPTTPYAASKASAELFVQSYARSFGVPVRTVRVCNVYGPRQYPEKVVPLFCEALLARPSQPCRIQGTGKNSRQYLYVTDAVAAIDVVRTTPNAAAITNVGSGDICTLSNLELAAALIGLAGYNDPAGLIEFVPDRLYNDASYHMKLDRIRSLGWAPEVDLESGLKKCLEWYYNNPDWFHRPGDPQSSAR